MKNVITWKKLCTVEGPNGAKTTRKKAQEQQIQIGEQLKK